MHAILKIGAGRSEADQEGDLRRLVRDHEERTSPPQYAERGLALSLEFIEFSESGTLKHNNLHARLKKP